VDYYDNGTPASYNAKMDIGGEEIALQVNKPYNRNWYETIYLVSHGNTPDTGVYCIVEIVREPWRWLSATGIVMLMLGAVMLFLRGPQHNKVVIQSRVSDDVGLEHIRLCGCHLHLYLHHWSYRCTAL
jgi:hypothetical protein